MTSLYENPMIFMLTEKQNVGFNSINCGRVIERANRTVEETPKYEMLTMRT